MVVRGFVIDTISIALTIFLISTILYFTLQTVFYMSDFKWLKKISIFCFIIFILTLFDKC